MRTVLDTAISYQRVRPFMNVKDAFIAGVEFVQKWNDARQLLPEIDEFVLWKTESENYFVCELDKDDSYDYFYQRTHATHWRRINLE